MSKLLSGVFSANGVKNASFGPNFAVFGPEIQFFGGREQGGITCGTIDEPRKSSKAIDKCVIIDFRDKNVVIARFCDINEVFI